MSPENKILQLELKIKATEFLEACRTRLAEIEAGLDKGFNPTPHAWENFEYLAAIIASAPRVAENLRSMPILRARVAELEMMVEALGHE